MLGNQAKSDLIKSQGANAPRNRSNFNLSHHHYSTLRFGEISPFFWLETVGGDKINLRSEHRLSTFTLKSPILSDVHLKKNYFNVPMEAILPFNWEKIYSNPVVGDDVNPNDVNCVFILPKFTKEMTMVNDPFAKLMLLYQIYGKSSIASRLGYNFNSLLEVLDDNDVPHDIDTIITNIFEEIFNRFSGKSIDVGYYLEDLSPKTYSIKLNDRSKLRELIRFCENHFVYYISQSGLTDNVIAGNNANRLDSIRCTFRFANLEDININIAPIFAYQIVCAHYYTNDKVDYIYSAELYRQLLQSYVGNVSYQTFVYNGITTQYDFCSGAYLNLAFEQFSTIDESATSTYVSYYLYLQNVFKINRSLRYADFFTGAKVRPLAIGDVAIDVNANQVSAVDVTRNIQVQRFLNFVNRVGRKFEEYAGKLSGVFVKPDYHNPQYLGATNELLFNSKLENTASEQWTQSNSITSQYVGNSKDFAFEFESDRPSIVLGLVSFDIERAYNKSINPEAFHIDRFDYFNPFMQHIGDQPILGASYDVSMYTHPETMYFGYQTRHAEYKEKYSYCDGGFNDDSLPTWLFVNKPIDENVVSPEAIRSYPEEFDQFYLILNGLTSDYFHFIVDFYNICNASRPMIKSPNIL